MLAIKRVFRENRLLIKMQCMYCIVLVLGILVASFFITRDMLEDLIATQLVYEKNVQQNISNDISDIYDDIVIVVDEFYIDISYASLIEILSSSSVQENKDGYIWSMLRGISESHDFITDIIILDRVQQKPYFHSSLRDRDIPTDYDFFSDANALFGDATNDKKITVVYEPEYILRGAENMAIISLYINLYDLRDLSDEGAIGLVIINIDPNVFIESLDSESVSGENLFIVHNDMVVTQNSRFEYAQIQGVTDARYKISTLNRDTGFIIESYIDTSNVQDILFNNMKQTVKIIIICVLLAVVVNIFISSNFFAKRIQKLVLNIRKIKQNGFNQNIHIKVYANDEIGYLEENFRDMNNEMCDYIEKVYVSDIKRKTAEIGALQAQINPHYMFNTLESIKMVALINNDTESATMINLLGNMFRWNMTMKELVVHISDEIEYTQTYIKLQKIRYENEFDIDIHGIDSIHDYGTPKIILQPIIENALYHAKGEGTLKIAVNIVVAQDITFEIIDNGHGIDEKRLLEVQSSLHIVDGNDGIYSIGLRNVNQRIKLLFSKDYGISIDSTVNEGTKVSIKIPKLSKEEMIRIVQRNDC